MLRGFLYLIAVVLAVEMGPGTSGPLYAQHFRGGSNPGAHSGFQRGFDSRFRGGAFDARFSRGRFDRFEGGVENRFGFGRFDRFENRFDRRFLFASGFNFGFNPFFGFTPGFGFGFNPFFIGSFFDPRFLTGF
jgi:hypothetical protein